MNTIISDINGLSEEGETCPLGRRESDKGPDWRNPNVFLAALKEGKIPRSVFMTIIHTLPKDEANHGDPVYIFEELRKAGATDETITEIMELLSGESIVMGESEVQKGGVVSLIYKEVQTKEPIDLDRLGILLEGLKSKQGKKMESIDKSNLHKDDIILLRFSKQKREGAIVTTLSFEIALLVEYMFSSTLVCLAQMDNPDKNGDAILENINTRLPIWQEGERYIENFREKIGQHLDTERQNMLSENYLREIILISNNIPLWKRIRQGVGHILEK